MTVGTPSTTVSSGLLIHIGYHKTGTSWLQQFLFKEPGLGFETYLERQEPWPLIIKPNSLDFDPSYVASMLPPLAPIYARGCVPVISSERLSGSPHAGGYDSKDIADRLKRVFPDARILIVIRNQATILGSIYQQYIKAGGTFRQDDYFVTPEAKLKRYPFFDFDYYAYHRLISYYFELFGSDKVLVLPYEMFINDGRSFVRAIVKFVGCSKVNESILDNLPYNHRENRSLSDAQTKRLRTLNVIFGRGGGNLHQPPLLPMPKLTRVLSRYLSKVDEIFPKRSDRKPSLSQEIAKLAVGRYGHSNRVTSSLIDLDLSMYGYELAPLSDG